MRKKTDLRDAERIRLAGNSLLHSEYRISRKLNLQPIETPEVRRVFDRACKEIHYAGACQRVGRCLRLAVTYRGEWAGGIVLGSTFPNIRPRDNAFGLTKYIQGWSEKGLVSPWASDNKDYWNRLQRVINHARTFIFPAFQGEGLGVSAHSLLLSLGVQIWERRYKDRVYGFDTLCTHPSSRLFLDNGWELVGRTQGYSRDPDQVFSKRAFESDWMTIKENAGLKQLEGNTRWWVWVKVLTRFK